MITPTGVKMLDFGLARLTEVDHHSTGARLTSVETVVGTIDYMAPEQLSTGEVDARTDIFAFGVVLYEMVMGQRPFDGRLRASLIGSILFAEPTPIPESRGVSAGMRRIIANCLQKIPDERFQTAHDLRLHLDWLRDGGTAEPPQKRRLHRAVIRKLPRHLAFTSLLLAAGLIGGSFLFDSSKPAAASMRFSVAAPEIPGTLDDILISPDGRHIAFLAVAEDGRRSLWVRALDSTRARRLPGTEEAQQPFWSADGSSIGFLSGQSLRTIALEGTQPRHVTMTAACRGASWNADGDILYAPHIATPLRMVPALGGAAREVTTLDVKAGDRSHRWPQFLPDGRRFLFVIQSTNPARQGLYLGSLDQRSIRRVAPISSRVVIAPTGWLVFVQQDALYAQLFDVGTARLEGQPRLIADEVSVDPEITGWTRVSAAADGTLTFMSGGDARKQLVWYDRRGNRLGSLGSPGRYVNPALSPDGRFLAVSRIDPESGRNSLWRLDVATAAMTRLVVDGNNTDAPVWSSDGRTLYFVSDRSGRFQAYAKDLGSDAPERVVYSEGTFPQVTDARGDALLVHVTKEPEGQLLLIRQGEPPRVLALESGLGQAVLSPDMKWVAFVHRDRATSLRDVFVARLDDQRRRVQISTRGGAQPTWSRDGQELFYVNSENQLMAAKVGAESVSSEVLFPIRAEDVWYAGRDFVPAGDRFLVIEPIMEEARSHPVLAIGALR